MVQPKESRIVSVLCPWCDKSIEVIKKTLVRKPAVKAEKDVTYIVRKSTQRNLFSEEEPPE